jgi:hypothetical protein
VATKRSGFNSHCPARRVLPRGSPCCTVICTHSQAHASNHVSVYSLASTCFESRERVLTRKHVLRITWACTHSQARSSNRVSVYSLASACFESRERVLTRKHVLRITWACTDSQAHASNYVSASTIESSVVCTNMILNFNKLGFSNDRTCNFFVSTLVQFKCVGLKFFSFPVRPHRNFLTSNLSLN